jgi:hypothetical protein
MNSVPRTEAITIINFMYVIAGIVSGFHAYTYGRWLKNEGNIPGSLLAYFLGVSAAALPIVRIIYR